METNSLCKWQVGVCPTVDVPWNCCARPVFSTCSYTSARSTCTLHAANDFHYLWKMSLVYRQRSGFWFIYLFMCFPPNFSELFSTIFIYFIYFLYVVEKNLRNEVNTKRTLFLHEIFLRQCRIWLMYFRCSYSWVVEKVWKCWYCSEDLVFWPFHGFDLQWSPCHTVVAIPLLIAFELLLCTYLDTLEGNL